MEWIKASNVDKTIIYKKKNSKFWFQNFVDLFFVFLLEFGLIVV